MSTALAWDTEPLLEPDDQEGEPLVIGRPPLRLVSSRSQPGTTPGHRVDRPVRMTRRARLVRFVLLLTMAMSLGWGVAGALSSGAAPQHTVTVESGQTLSEIAAHALPGLPVTEGVAQIQLANGLSSSEVHAGQVLQIPAVG